jgi:uncharacterized peroxidase-related enzyme
MSRLAIPASVDEAPAASQALLGDVAAKSGRVPTMFRLLSVSPVALEAFLGFRKTLERGSLGPAMAQRIALAVSEANGARYCVAAQTFRARRLVGLDDAEITANRNGASNDPRADVAVHFAAKIVRTHGTVSDEDLRELKSAGFGDAEILEIIAQVALTTFANYANKIGDAELDFPAIAMRKAA